MGIRDKIFKKSNEIDEDEEYSFMDSNHDVFISYSTKDTDDANEVCHILEQNNIKCWIAPRNISMGMNFSEQILNAVGKSKAVVLVSSFYSQRSDYVLKEIKEAFNKNIPIILFNIDEAIPDGDIGFYTKIYPFVNKSPIERNYDLLVRNTFNTCYGPDHPFSSYDGVENYIFVSFAHEDTQKVFPEIRKFQDLGYNVCYDEEEDKDRSRRLAGSNLCIVFVTNNSMASKKVYNDIYDSIAIYNKNIVPIYLEDFDSIELDDELEFQLSRIQGIIKTTLVEEEYVSKFVEACEKFGLERSTDNV